MKPAGGKPASKRNQTGATDATGINDGKRTTEVSGRYGRRVHYGGGLTVGEPLRKQGKMAELVVTLRQECVGVYQRPAKQAGGKPALKRNQTGATDATGINDG